MIKSVNRSIKLTNSSDIPLLETKLMEELEQKDEFVSVCYGVYCSKDYSD